jgi:hypothetical protein
MDMLAYCHEIGYEPLQNEKRLKRLYDGSAVEIRSITSNPDVTEMDHYEVTLS